MSACADKRPLSRETNDVSNSTVTWRRAGWLALATLAVVALAIVACDPRAGAKDPPKGFPEPFDDQPQTTPRLTAEEALKRLKVPQGYHASLFAAEPDVRQPIAAAFDARGRMWVAENYTYANSKTNYDLTLRDRIVVLEDENQDGRAEKRTIFWDDVQRLTSVEVGFGGVWAMAPPNLYFIPDEDGDARPDGPPVVMLDGWDDAASRHNFTNGLRWGPDGWLYGRNGILATSQVGVPGTPQEQRTPMNCGIWRFHPTRRTFEVVCHGTTNPWGHDWDDHGQLFFINTVIGHLWHVVPGAHFRRMYGDDLNPYCYELIEQTADHFHWDAAVESWTEQRKGVTPGTDKAGGGHAHSGLMIYLGDNWPHDLRGSMFTVNLHGQRLNRDRLERAGATYVGRHAPDFLTSTDPWFRAVDLMYGPDGAVFLLDWSDIGECHENDGVDRSSGRIFKIESLAGRRRAASRQPVDLPKATPQQLAELQLHPNDWYVRQARRALQERAARGEDVAPAHVVLRDQLAQHADATRRLRALWALHVSGGLTTADLVRLLEHSDEHLRLWAVQLLVETTPTPETVAALVTQAQRESSGLVLTFFASALQRIPAAARWQLAAPLVKHAELADDRVYPLVVWYGLEAAAAEDPAAAVALVRESQLPKVNRFLARRLASQVETRPEGVAALVGWMRTKIDESHRLPVLAGLVDGLRGWQKAPAPEGWSELAALVNTAGNDESRQLARELSIVFGDGRAIDDVKKVAADKNQSSASRRQAIRALAAARVPGLVATLTPLLGDTAIAEDAVRGLASADLTTAAPVLLENYRRVNRPGRLAIVEAFATRRDTAKMLLAAVEKETIGRTEVAPFVLRQMQLLGDESLQKDITRLWPELRLIETDKLGQIASWRTKLSDERLRGADLASGRKLYDEACGKCHKLFGEGGAIGPELTGAQRTNLNYWLENIIDPSAVVAASFRMAIVELDDGRVLNGVVGAATPRTLTLQTPTEKLTLDRRTVVSIRPSTLSLMPEGQLARLSEDQVRDLVAYLMSPRQTPRADQGGGKTATDGGGAGSR